VVLRRELLRLFIAHLPALVGEKADTRGTFAALFPVLEVKAPTESTEVTGLAFELGEACGLDLSRTYQLPRTSEGAHRVVFVVKGAASPQQQSALRESLQERAGRMKVEVGPHPVYRGGPRKRACLGIPGAGGDVLGVGRRRRAPPVGAGALDPH